MKKRTDPRHARRQKIIKKLFSWSFNPLTATTKKTKLVVKYLNKIDPLIEKNACQWPLSQIAKIDLAILRLAIYELLVDNTQPTKVIIDEAIELAKEFGGETSPAFVNGVLGTVIKQTKLKYGKKD